MDDVTCLSRDEGGHTLQFRVTPSTGDDKKLQYLYLELNIAVTTEVGIIILVANFSCQ